MFPQACGFSLVTAEKPASISSFGAPGFPGAHAGFCQRSDTPLSPGHVQRWEGRPKSVCRPSATTLGSAEAGTRHRPVSQDESGVLPEQKN